MTLYKMSFYLASKVSLPKDTVSTEHLDIERWENDGGRIVGTSYIY